MFNKKGRALKEPVLKESVGDCDCELVNMGGGGATGPVRFLLMNLQ